MAKRNRRIKSIQNELILKSREAALTAIQIFNNPLVQFKAELFIVIICIAWTYLLHAYFRNIKKEYRYFKLVNGRRIFDKTKGGAFKHWELERCLNDADCQLDNDVKNNLRFLVGLRHEIEHQMTTRIDETLSAKFQACCLNYNNTMKKLFGAQRGIEKYLSFSLQFAALSREQVDMLSQVKGLPNNIQKYIYDFDSNLSNDEFNSFAYAYRVLFVEKTANRKGQADHVIEFVKAGTPLAEKITKTYALIKETERPKYLPSEIIYKIQREGFPKFKMHAHTLCWKARDAKNPNKGFGVKVAKTWYWYETWFEEVLRYCHEHKEDYV